MVECGSLQLADKKERKRERVMSNYPKELDGNLIWACCVSTIDAGNCNHLRAREGRPLNGQEGESDE